MNKSIFERCSDVQSFYRMLNLCVGSLEEHNLPKNDFYNVVDADLNSCRYMTSSKIGDRLVKHWFTYGEDGSPFRGVAHSTCGSSDIVPDVLPRYTEISRFHDNCWVLGAKDGTYDLYLNGAIYKESFIKYDILALGGVLGFLQLDTAETRSLVCIESKDMVNGIFIPQDEYGFEAWFLRKFMRYGYEGALNEHLVSDIFVIYFEVINCIFKTANYKPLEI